MVANQDFTTDGLSSTLVLLKSREHKYEIGQTVTLKPGTITYEKNNKQANLPKNISVKIIEINFNRNNEPIYKVESTSTKNIIIDVSEQNLSIDTSSNQQNLDAPSAQTVARYKKNQTVTLIPSIITYEKDKKEAILKKNISVKIIEINFNTNKQLIYKVESTSTKNIIIDVSEQNLSIDTSSNQQNFDAQITQKVTNKHKYEIGQTVTLKPGTITYEKNNKQANLPKNISVKIIEINFNRNNEPIYKVESTSTKNIIIDVPEQNLLD